MGPASSKRCAKMDVEFGPGKWCPDVDAILDAMSLPPMSQIHVSILLGPLPSSNHRGEPLPCSAVWDSQGSLRFVQNGSTSPSAKVCQESLVLPFVEVSPYLDDRSSRSAHTSTIVRRGQSIPRRSSVGSARMCCRSSRSAHTSTIVRRGQYHTSTISSGVCQDVLPFVEVSPYLADLQWGLPGCVAVRRGPRVCVAVRRGRDPCQSHPVCQGQLLQC